MTVEYIGDRVSALSQDEKRVLCFCLARYGTECPIAPCESALPFFAVVFVLRCLAQAYYFGDLHEHVRETVKNMCSKLDT